MSVDAFGDVLESVHVREGAHVLIRALHQIGDERAVPALRKLTEGDLDGRLKRLAEEAVDRIMKGIEEEKKEPGATLRATPRRTAPARTPRS
ncbi:MAG: hypothetical protein HC882_05475 [Acidobacteria bacterium]|nr:hypothetical protein [Acidobacteriota bacterium]